MHAHIHTLARPRMHITLLEGQDDDGWPIMLRVLE